MNALGSLPGIIAGAMGQTLFRAATLHKSRGGVQRSCRALVVEFTDWQRAQGMQAFEGSVDVPATIPSSDRNVIILAATLADTPKANDTLVIDGGAWRIHNVKSDPANATYECRSTRCPIPSGDTTEADSETLLDDLPDIMNGALGPALFSPAILYKVTGRIGDGRGGFVSTFSEYQCSAIITDYSDFARGVDGIPAKDRKVLILSASLPGYVIVKPNDIIVIADQAWGLVKVDQDPAGATYEGQGSPARLPTVGRIGTAAISLRDATLSAQGTSRIVASANITLRDALAVGSSSITLSGALAVTLADATVAGTIDFTNRGALAVTLANATVAGQGSPVGEGQGAGMLVSATLNAQGSPRITGALAVTLANASIEASGPVSGELAKNLANASLVATGTVRTIGALSYQLADATLQASGVSRIVGALAVTLADATGVGVASSQINGSLSLTINDATLSATGVLRVNGSLSQALSDGTVSSAGYQRNAGAVAITLDGSTLAATSSPRVTGALAITLDNSQLIAGAANVGQLGITLAGSTLAAAGYQANWGALAVTLNDATLSAAGSSYVQGAGAATLASATVISEGYQRNAGALAATLSDAILSASSDLAITGSAAITLENSIAVSNGSIQNPGQLARALDDSTLIATGYQRNAGALAATLNDATLSADASIRLNGAGASTLNSATVISEGYQRNAGSLAATLQDATALSTGILAIHGALAVTLSNSTLAATADLAPIGSLAVTLDGSTVSAVGTPTNSAALAQTLANATTSFTGTSTIQGALAKTLDDAILEAFGENGEEPAYDTPLSESVEYSLGIGDDQTVTIDVPAGSGTLLVVSLYSDGTNTAPAGWTAGPSGSTAYTTVSWYYRVVTGSEDASYDFTAPGGSFGLGVMMRITGADISGDPFEASYLLQDGTSGAHRYNDGITTTLAETLLLCFSDGASAITYPPTGWDYVTVVGTSGSNIVYDTAGMIGDTPTIEIGQPMSGYYVTMMVGILPAELSTPDPVEGEAAITLVDAGLSAAGTPNNVGVLAQTLADATIAATGTLSDPAPVIQGTVVTKVTSATASDTINKPTGATAGELLLMLIGQYQGIGGTDTITTPAGWRLAPFGMLTSFVTGVGTMNLYAFYRWCDGTEGSTFPINITSSNVPAVYLNSMCMRISGVDATNPWGAGSSDNEGNSSTRNMATLSTDEDNSLLLAYTLGWNQALSGGFSGMTQVAVMNTVTELYRQDISAAGSVSAKNATQAGSDAWHVFGMSLRPGAGGGINPNPVPTFVASGALSTATSKTSRTPAAPSGATTNDIEIVTCASENNATHSYSGSGWTKGGQINSGSGWTVSWGWRRRTGSNVDPVISWTGTADASARRHAYRGCITSGTPVAAIGTAGTGTGSTHTSTGGNTTAENSLVIYLDHALANTALGQPTGWTENTDSGSATGPVRTAVGRKAMGASGSASGNISVTGAAAAWVNLQLELKAN